MKITKNSAGITYYNGDKTISLSHNQIAELFASLDCYQLRQIEENRKNIVKVGDADTSMLTF